MRRLHPPFRKMHERWGARLVVDLLARWVEPPFAGQLLDVVILLT